MYVRPKGLVFRRFKAHFIHRLNQLRQGKGGILNNNLRSLIYFASLCAALSVVTTLMLEFLPMPTTDSVQDKMLLSQNTFYMASKWALFFHPQFTLLSFIGLAAIFYRRHPVWVIPGVIFASIWAVCEMVQQGILIDAVNMTMRRQYLLTESVEAQDAIKNSLATLSALSGSLFMVLVYAVGHAYFAFAVVMSKQKQTLCRLIGGGMFVLSISSYLSFIGYYFYPHPAITWLLDGFFNLGYPIVAPALRMTLAVWLWQCAQTFYKTP